MEIIKDSLSRLGSLADTERIAIQTKNLDLTYEVDLDSNFEDRKAFVNCASRFLEEATILNNFNNFIHTGVVTYGSMLYSWRSISQTIPALRDDIDKSEYYQTVHDVLESEIGIIFDFVRFVLDEAVPAFVKEFNSLQHLMERKDSISSGILHTMMKVMDMFFLLDNLKDTKVSIKNDFSTFKRYGQMVVDKKKLSPLLRDSENANKISMFLAQNQQILAAIKNLLSVATNPHILIFEMIQASCTLLEKEQWFDPNEKYQHIRGILYCLFLLDNQGMPLSKFEKKKEFPCSRIEKIIKESVVIPMIGDMQINTLSVLKKIHTANMIDMLNLNDTQFMKSLEFKYNLPAYILSIRPLQFKILANLGKCKAEVLHRSHTNNPTSIALSLKDKFTVEESSEIFNSIQEAFSYLAKLTEYIQSYFAWKMVNPATVIDPSEVSETPDAYELLTKYNYSSDEKVAMVHAITYIKSLYNSLLDMETLATPAIASYIYGAFQGFIVNEISLILSKLKKSAKLEVLKMTLTGIKDSCYDMACGASMVDIKKVSTIKKKSDLSHNGSMNYKCVGPLTTQIYMVVTTMNSILHNAEYRKQMEGSMLAAISTFITKIPLYVGLLNYRKTLQSCGNLGLFWFREFYLEMASSSKIQYPIEASLPWIFASHIIETSDPSLIESLLFVLDLYNDSAQYALTVLKRKYLYDEIEAEVNLIFEQLVYKLAEKVYSYYRTIASGMYFKKSIKAEINRTVLKYSDKKIWADSQISFPMDHRYKSVLTQKSVQLLGREINLSFLLSQRVILAMRKSLDVALSIYENSGIYNIMEFHQLIEVSKITHQLFSEYFILPTFELMFDEANHGVRSNMTRVTLHTLWDLVNDFIPNYAYCSSLQRFVRGSISYVKEIKHQKAPSTTTSHLFGYRALTQAFSAHAEMYRQFVGSVHFTLLLRYLNHGGLSVIIEQITRYANVLVTEKFSKYVSVLRQGLPQKISLPRFQYGFSGTVKFYSVNFENIFKYKDLYPRIFQCMREIGNCIIFTYQLEAAKKQMEVFDQFTSAFYQGVKPKVTSVLGVGLNPLLQQSCMGNFIKNLNPDTQELFQKAQLLCVENLTFGLSFFDFLLYNIKTVLVGDPWDRKIPNNGAIAVDNCNEFYRVFGVLCVAMVHTVPPKDCKIEQIFGDGLIWCGQTLVMLLGQSDLSESLDFINHALRVANNEDVELTLAVTFSSGNRTLRGRSANPNESARTKILPKMKNIRYQRKFVDSILNHFKSSIYYANCEQIRCFATPTYVPPTSAQTNQG